MKPRFRTVPPRVATAGDRRRGAAFAAPRRGQRRGDVDVRQRHVLTVTSDDASRQRSRSASRGGNITAPGVNNVPNDGTRQRWSSTPAAATTRSTSGRPELRRPPAVNGGDGDDTITGTPRHRRDRRRQRQRPHHGRRTGAASETIHGGAGNDVIIWNNGDGDDINEGDRRRRRDADPRGGTADDGNTITQEGTTTRFERTSGAGGFKVFSTNTMEKLTLQSFSGNDSVTTGPGVPIAHEHRLRPRQRQHLHRRRPGPHPRRSRR